MKSQDNQKTYFIYIRRTGEKVPVTKEQHDCFYREASRIRNKEQNHHRCMCPYRFIWKCDGDCIGCEYHAAGDTLSLDVPNPDGNGNMYDYLQDSSIPIDEVIADRIMMNKLIFSGKVILKPYVEGIRNGSTDDSFHRVQELTSQLAKNTEQRENLQKLAAQGFIDKILFNTETNKLLSNADDFRKEIEALNNTVSLDVSKVTAATDLLHFAEKGEMLHGFDEELFEKYVRQITVKNRTEFSFELKCGLCLTERI